MTMAYDAGRVEGRRCPVCDRVVGNRMYMVIGECRIGTAVPVITTYWSPNEHEAPCGLPCTGGGITGKDVRSGNHHGCGDCPRCTRAQTLADRVKGRHR